MYQVDVSKTAAQNRLAMINANSTVVFTGDEFTVGPPQVNTPPQGEDTNTTILIDSLEGTGYMNSRTARYKRLTVGATRPGAFSTWYVTSRKTRAQLILDILENHQLLASDVDFTGLSSMPAAGQQGQLTCTAKADSYFYIGTFNFTVENTDT